MWAPLPCVIHVSKTGYQNSRMVKNERFSQFSGQRYPVLEFNGHNQTEIGVGWLKMNFFSNLFGQSEIMNMMPTIITVNKCRFQTKIQLMLLHHSTYIVSYSRKIKYTLVLLIAKVPQYYFSTSVFPIHRTHYFS